MRFIRFSLRRLLIVTALVAVLLYVLLLRPTAVARNFAHKMEVATQTDFESVSRQHFDGMRTDGAILEVKFYPRSWTHVLGCKQLFSINMTRPTNEQNKWLVSVRDFYATPTGVKELRGPVLELRQQR
jgi:hypothetical protein